MKEFCRKSWTLKPREIAFPGRLFLKPKNCAFRHPPCAHQPFHPSHHRPGAVGRAVGMVPRESRWKVQKKK